MSTQGITLASIALAQCKLLAHAIRREAWMWLASARTAEKELSDGKRRKDPHHLRMYICRCYTSYRRDMNDNFDGILE